jgi:hypothetical protein
MTNRCPAIFARRIGGSLPADRHRTESGFQGSVPHAIFSPLAASPRILPVGTAAGSWSLSRGDLSGYEVVALLL